jgi:hypothetical protein
VHKTFAIKKCFVIMVPLKGVVFCGRGVVFRGRGYLVHIAAW